MVVETRDHLFIIYLDDIKDKLGMKILLYDLYLFIT